MLKYKIIFDSNFEIKNNNKYSNTFSKLLFKNIVQDIINYKEEKIYHPGKIIFNNLKLDLVSFIFDGETLKSLERNKNKAIHDFNTYKNSIIYNITNYITLPYSISITTNIFDDLLDIANKPFVKAYFIIRNLQKTCQDYVMFIEKQYTIKDVIYDYYKSYIRLCEYLGFKEIMPHIINYLSYRFLVETENNKQILDYLIDKLNLKTINFHLLFFLMVYLTKITNKLTLYLTDYLKIFYENKIINLFISFCHILKK